MSEPTPPADRRARLMRVVGIVVLVLGVTSGRVIERGESELEASTNALRAGNPREATVRARRAAGWYVPGAPHVSVAYRRLAALARAAEKHRRPDDALRAWRAIRTAALETRWAIVPQKQRLAEANREIARLEAGGSKSADGGAAYRTHLAELERSEAPRTLGVVGLGLGLGLWGIGLLWWSRLTAGAGGSLVPRKARIPAVMAAVGMAIWLVAVWRA